MHNLLSSSGIAFRIWIFTSGIFSIIFAFLVLPAASFTGVFFLSLACSLIGSIPALITLLIAIPVIRKTKSNISLKFILMLVIYFFLSLIYGFFAYLTDLSFLFSDTSSNLDSAILLFVILLGSSILSSIFSLKRIFACFNDVPLNYVSYPLIFNCFSNSHIKINTMQIQQDYPQSSSSSQSNKVLFKGLIAGGLILLMLIPTLFISTLITEREQRQKEVVAEVSSKWANSQTISGPYLVVPYNESAINSDGKPVFIKRQLIVLSKNMNVKGEITPENRPRSIYKVLLYKSNLNIEGIFSPQWPADIDPARLDMTNAKICFGLSDYKGIEEEIAILFNSKSVVLTPGLPTDEMEGVGLSAPVSITFDSLNAGIKYSMNAKLKGSARLHFMPLSANSSFEINSKWADPSFDGNTLPNSRTVSVNGFNAKWNYNQANLPFGTIIKNGNVINRDLSFGVSMVQPADHYNKTMRSVKYAILIIGLTFALFFIIELMQKKPFHPVQYVLVGLALVIFYTLLLSVSEYLIFDYAYFIASAATILMITLYAGSHFRSRKTAAVFAFALSLLYGFIFILLRLEDTALLVGSIGLFIVLAVVMYVSRKVNWYGNTFIPDQQ